MEPTPSNSINQQQWHFSLEGNKLVQRHPVLTPVTLLGGAVLLLLMSPFAYTLFPLLVLLGLSPTQLCFALAYVLAISGILISIVGVIRYMNQYCLRPAIVSKSKE